MNSIAINAEGNFFSFVKTDPALFHSILYLVALHRDIYYGLADSPICLYHGSEAFRIINERLENNFVFDDVTIAAVAMLVNKEVLSLLHLVLKSVDAKDRTLMEDMSYLKCICKVSSIWCKLEEEPRISQGSFGE